VKCSGDDVKFLKKIKVPGMAIDWLAGDPGLSIYCRVECVRK